MWGGDFNYTEWNRSRISAAPEQLEAKGVEFEFEGVILDWVDMDMKPVSNSKSGVHKLLRKLGI